MAGINRTISMLSRVHITAGKPLMTADGSCGFSNEKLVKRKKAVSISGRLSASVR